VAVTGGGKLGKSDFVEGHHQGGKLVCDIKGVVYTNDGGRHSVPKEPPEKMGGPVEKNYLIRGGASTSSSRGRSITGNQVAFV